ncbi:Tad domain-containing protein [Phaeobacter porticola]|uniref:Flp pilus-assembly TadE/G-like/von Willebrand factor type A domain protein n=1 Tax=Phaeobacter porticola TaxID=1844006 RepID=A0A1L3I2D4_9RHOB|nr:Tad domain-containing protein [Phaeobacter porticola]APG46270.1 Putative Flp pilus-assembly TadE/G-like/von Willebrand factor type A domain protein [Phaeobacter porticola]
MSIGFDNISIAVRQACLTACIKGGAELRAFRQDESGVLVKPMVGFLLSMLAVGGIGVDLMRMERDRTILQYTLDRAVLAAADLDQPLPPAVVVQDYLNKAGLNKYYTPPVAETGIGFKKVQSTIDTTFETHMLKFSSGQDMPLYATSRAEESIDALEISLVLDVSGSMRSNSRLTNLKIAAKEFIDTMVANTTDGKMSVSIVPYATQVSLPAELLQQYNATEEHEYSNCVNFTGPHFQSTALSTTEELKRTMHFSPWSGSDYRTSSNLVSSPVCEDRADREILPLQKDADTLKDFIQNLYAQGNTSIDVGMKWGTALLDPSARPAISALSGGGGAMVPATFSNRPVSFNDNDTVKIIVLMTDGQNTSQYYVESDHREGPSDVYYNPAASSSRARYSTYDPQRDKYYWDNMNRWEDHAYGQGSYRKCNSSYCWWQDEEGEPAQVQRLSYADLFADTSLKYLYKYLYGDWMGQSSARSTWYYGVYDSWGTTTKNARTSAVCTAAKSQGIVVYTIGFEAPNSGTAVLKDCASSDAHHFDVEGLEISDAFASIATSIRQLRLTQ